MPAPPTLAIEINQQTYILAVACLPEDFRMIHPPKTYGNYLILNEKTTIFFRGVAKETRIENTVIDKKTFETYYDFVEMGASLTFARVKHKQDEPTPTI